MRYGILIFKSLNLEIRNLEILKSTIKQFNNNHLNN